MPHHLALMVRQEEISRMCDGGQASGMASHTSMKFVKFYYVFALVLNLWSHMLAGSFWWNLLGQWERKTHPSTWIGPTLIYPHVFVYCVSCLMSWGCQAGRDPQHPLIYMDGIDTSVYSLAGTRSSSFARNMVNKVCRRHVTFLFVIFPLMCR